MGIKKPWEKEANGCVRKCRCPKCHKIHKSRVLYIGPAEFPPFFCNYCKELIERCNYETLDYQHEASVVLNMG